jgi:hypothetical protein
VSGSTKKKGTLSPVFGKNNSGSSPVLANLVWNQWLTAGYPSLPDFFFFRKRNYLQKIPVPVPEPNPKSERD